MWKQRGKANMLKLLGVGHASGLALTCSALAQAPCGGLYVGHGAVGPTAPLKVTATLDDSDLACAKAIAHQLSAIAALRSVTVAARVSEAQRAAGGGLQVASAWAQALVAAGVPAARVVAVAPLTALGEPPSVRIAYFEQRGARTVAVLAAASGTVTAGTDPARLQPIRIGAPMAAYDHLQTSDGSTAKLVLADGSSLLLSASTLLRVGAVELNSALKRVIKIDLYRGRIEAQVSPSHSGAQFEIVTPRAIACVRGTRFRVAVSAEGANTQVETLSGQVELRTDKGAVLLNKGQGSKVTSSNMPGTPSALVGPALGLQPQKGTVKGGAVAQWHEVATAAGYVVEVAVDAEFMLQMRTWHVAGPQWAIDPSLVGKRWFWRVTPLDTNGFWGVSSKVYAITVE